MRKIISGLLLMLFALMASASALPFRVEDRGAVVAAYPQVFDSIPSTISVGLVSSGSEMGFDLMFDRNGKLIWGYLIVPVDRMSEALSVFNGISRNDIVYVNGYTPTLLFNGKQLWSSGQQVR